jgi:DGQHR domain-containing protein
MRTTEIILISLIQIKTTHMLIKVLKCTQNDNSVYTGKMSVAELIKVSDVDFADPDVGRNGYQRKPNEKRFHEIANYMKYDKSMLPPAIIMSYRGTLKTSNKHGEIMDIEIPAGEKLWVIDGQHRLGGLKLLATDESYDSAHYKNFQMPVVIIECPSINVEAYQFSIINSEAKKVSKYLANEGILKGGGKGLTGKKSWLSRAVATTDYLYKSPDSLMFKRIKHPNSPRGGDYFCSALGMMNSLDSLLNDATYSSLWEKDEEKVKKMVADYWAAWQEVIPFCFDEHRDYALFKSSGMISVNYCLMAIIGKIGKRYPSQEEFETVIKKLGRYTTKDYWHVNSVDGMIHNLGKGQIIEEARKISNKILEVKI